MNRAAESAGDPVATLVDRLGLAPHPEGGYYRELFRSTREITTGDGRRRSAVTTIYYLLPAGQHSRWHRVSSDEVWHLYQGGPLELWLAPPELTSVERVRLAPPDAGGDPVATVPAGWWQAARAGGRYALAGCTVSPGFDFADLSFLREDTRLLEGLQRLSPELARLA